MTGVPIWPWSHVMGLEKQKVGETLLSVMIPVQTSLCCLCTMHIEWVWPEAGGAAIPCPGLRGAWLHGCEWAHGCSVEKVVQWLSVPGWALGNEAWQRREEKECVCRVGMGLRVPMQPGRRARWCRTASILLTCHAAATLSSARSG